MKMDKLISDAKAEALLKDQGVCLRMVKDRTSLYSMNIGSYPFASAKGCKVIIDGLDCSVEGMRNFQKLCEVYDRQQSQLEK